MTIDQRIDKDLMEVTDRFGSAMRYVKMCSLAKTTGEIANKIGVASSTLSSIERGDNVLNLYILIKFINLYNLNPVWFLKGEGQIVNSSELHAMVADHEKRITELERFVNLPVKNRKGKE